jgi:predicted phage terminase large subunit-like protein
MNSLAESLASLPASKQAEIFADITEAQAAELLWRWDFWARPAQLPPEGNWSVWLILAGRGFGKTRTGAEWVRSIVCGKTPLAAGAYKRIALIAETAADAREVLVEGDSGILSVHPPDFRPTYEPSKRRLTWPNGAIATLFNGTEPDQLRGPQFDAAWVDEIAKYRYAQETWDMLQFGLRLGNDPRQVVTTTPRPIKTLKDILAERGTVVTKGSTYDNKANLAPKFLAKIEQKYAGTRLGRQELDAEILDDAPGALWTRSKLDEKRVAKTAKLPEMKRVVVAIDPASEGGGEGEIGGGAETGIIVAGLGVDGRGYVLDDFSTAADPNGWARRAIDAFDEYEADLIIAEKNQGGAMVEAVIRSVRRTVPFQAVHASRGKVTRAEPIAALYEQGRVSHVGTFSALEDQMVVFTPFGIEGGTTGDRVDALVWGLSQLFPGIIHHTEKTGTAQVKQDRWQRAFARARGGDAENSWKLR